MLIPFESLKDKDSPKVSDFDHKVDFDQEVYKEGTLFISCRSETDPQKEYCVICEDDWTCTCPAFLSAKEPHVCKHIKSVTIDLHIIFEKIVKEPTWSSDPAQSMLRYCLLNPEHFKASIVANLLQFGRRVFVKEQDISF